MRVRTRAIIAGIIATILGCSAAITVASGNSENDSPVSATLQNPKGTSSWKLGTTVRNGTILSMNSTHMVVVRTHMGKAEHLEFILNSGTVRKGEIAVGCQVTVHYRIENNQNIATSIQTRKALVIQ